MAHNAAIPAVAFRLDAGQCVGCAVCADACPERALVMGSSELRPVWIAARCTNCGICEAECPTAAIRLAFSGLRRATARS